VIKDFDDVSLIGSRKWVNDYGRNHPELVEAVRKLPVDRCILDAEFTFFKKGTDRDVPLTALATQAKIDEMGVEANLVIFDVLYVDNDSVEHLGFDDRDEILRNIIPKDTKYLMVPKTVKNVKQKEQHFQELEKRKFEGVVEKEADSPYRQGERTPEWLKVKNWKCVTGSTLVTMADGTQREIQYVQEGDYVWCVEPESIQKFKVAVKKKYFYAINGDILEIAVGNVTLQITANHKVFTNRGWILTSEVKVGDKMLRIGATSEELREILRQKGKNLAESGFLDSIRPKAIEASLKWRREHRKEFLENCSKAGRLGGRKSAGKLVKWRENHPEEMSKAGLKAWNKSPEERKERVKPLVIWVGQHKGKDSNILKWKIQNPEVASQISSQNMAELRRRMAKKRGRQPWLSDGQRYLWGLLDALGIAFVKEHPFPFKRLVKTRWGGETEITYHFCMDVALLDKKVNIEYDGDPTHYSEKGKQKDAVRDAYLKAQGWTIYRIRFDRNKSGREANKFFVRSLTQLPEILSQILGVMTVEVKNPFAIWQKVSNIEWRKFAGIVYDIEVANNVHTYLANNIVISNSDEAIVCGCIRGNGKNSSTFGSLIIAQKGKDGKLHYIGKAAGLKGFEAQQMLKKLNATNVLKSPLVGVPSDVAGEVQQWCSPKMVIEVKYLNRTENGLLRMPDFLRERPDKKPSEVTLKTDADANIL